MIEVTQFRNQKVAVLGLARSGLASAASLQRGGAAVMAWDDAAAKRDAAAQAGLPIVDLGAADFASARALVLSPGIPHSYPKPHPVAAKARAAGVPIIGDIELLALAQRQAHFAGITGTNGKSTTTALVGHILAQAGRKAKTGGNLGVPVLLLEALGADGVYVLELSSYQLELTESLVLDVAILLNITPDHLDRHGGMAGYVAAKRRVFRGQGAKQTAIIGIDDDICRGIFAELQRAGRQRIVPISVRGVAPGGVYLAGGHLIDDLDGAAKPVLDMKEAPLLPGPHNGQNAAAAYAAAPLASTASRASPAWRTARSRSRPSMGSATSTIPRRPMPTPPRRQSPATTTSIGSPAAAPRKTASARWRRCFRASAAPS